MVVEESFDILADIDLTQPTTFVDKPLQTVWQQLRKHQPVAWHPHGDRGFWVVSNYQYAVDVYRNQGVFCSEKGNVLESLLSGGDPAGGKMLAVTDGERHTQIRRALLKSFSAKTLKSIRPRLVSAMHDLIARGVAEGKCDIAVDIAPYIPLMAICDMLGIPADDRALLLKHTSAALGSEEPDSQILQAKLARNEILLYFASHLKNRQSQQQDDLIDRLFELQQGPLALTEEELIYNCYSLMIGGDETARLTIISIVKTLIEHPEVWQQLKSGTIPLNTAADEFLRWVTPAMHCGRQATASIELGGQSIQAGDVVTVWNNSANFDEATFERPNQLNLTRQPNPHLSFGFGAHYCLGAQLAKVEVEVFLEVLIKLVERITLIGEPAPVYSNFLSGYCRLPVQLLGTIHDS